MNMDSLYGYSVCPVNQTDKFAAIDQVIDNCSIFEGLMDNKERFRRAVHRREIIETTGIGHGVAIAHGKLPCIDHLRIGLGISKQGINFKAKDGKPVHILFVIASTPFHQINYLKALAVILRGVRNPEIRDEVLNIFTKDFKPIYSKTFLKELIKQDFNYLNV
ncbi:MAG: PTS sugar transporter subunit IIA [Sphaerochaetaceae bacterium]|nr:PTS sugar transporter subunit IIA [Sphaerochaetaceae bacterium]MDC7237526.1 PTS sugar transporter subunit IIA [Sphaerochaetaceae bacterium]MDC7242629.1 PTS sugar transporter subunit IIA [Sphaerochaetaceae bacterium]MDC7249047.1 PTS sugar transporter subunit IIA [Sphaerochaetaceae bacterium]